MAFKARAVISYLGMRACLLFDRPQVSQILVPIARCADQHEFKLFHKASKAVRAEMTACELALLQRGRKGFGVPGWCSVCNMQVRFWVDYVYSYVTHNNRPVPNWRERLICPICGLNNR